MKSLFLTITLIALTTFGYAQDQKGNTITITIENFKNNDGTALVSLHTADTFMKGTGIENAAAEINDGKAVITFDNVPQGEYAIMVLHDMNNNQRMDFEDNGMPKESYGMSNNPKSYGPPNYNEAKFEMGPEKLELSITL